MEVSLVTIARNFACIGNLTGSDIGTWYQCIALDRIKNIHYSVTGVKLQCSEVCMGNHPCEDGV